MKHVIAGNLTLLMLAGCSAASTTQPKPGMWQWTSKTEIVDVTGLPPAMAAQLRAGGVPPRPGSIECISPAEAARQTTDFVKGRGDSNCRFADLKATGGNFSGTAECGAATDPLRGKGEIKGSVAPEEMHFSIEMTIALPQTKDATVRMHMQRDGKRIGECSAEPKG